MLRTYKVEINDEDAVTVTYTIEATDSYDAKLKAKEEFYNQFGMSISFSDITSCVEQ